MKIGYRTKFYEQYGGGSSFHGSVGRCFWNCILTFILVVCTAGLGTPWAICMWHKYKMNNLVIDGQEIVFEGKGRQLFWLYHWLVLVTIFTLGWWGVWAHVKIEDWLVERTHIKRYDEMYPGEYSKQSVFCGSYFEHIRRVFFQVLFTVLTLGLAMPWVICMDQRWHLDNMIIDGRQVIFEGTGRKFFWRYVAWVILTVLTLGIWACWMAVEMLRWDAKYTHFDNSFYTKVEPELV